jgi:hypothetical protein
MLVRAGYKGRIEKANQLTITPDAQVKISRR